MPRNHDRLPDELLSGPEDTPVVHLLDAASEYEVSILERWLERELGRGASSTVRITSSRRGKGGDIEALAEALSPDVDTYVIPLRIVWLAPKHNGRRAVSWFDVIPLGDPRDPRALRARWTRMMRPSRVKLVAGPGALASEMRRDYADSGQVDPFTSYVTRRAWLVLDQAERRIRGNRYKIPRFVPEAILSRREFLEAVDTVAADTGMASGLARDKAEGYLREIAATHSAYVIDILANLIHKLYSQGYGKIRYREEDVRRLAELGENHPVVFLPSHRSNLDRLSLQFMLWENDLPPNHTAGGINLNFFPVGPLVRRTGVFFIRRSFKDNPLYKTVLRSYLDYLIEKRFPLEWYMEGGRSRSGKLLPPRLGLLSYVVDALRRGKADRLQLVPVSIAYDQIHDVPDYAREAQGKDKEKESIGWLIRAVRSLRRRYGDIHVRFGEPVTVTTPVESVNDDEDAPVELQKLAFEVMYRIGRATPITPTALASIALLAARGAARTGEEIAGESGRLIAYATARSLPMTEDLHPGEISWIEPVLDGLVENGDVSSHEALGRRVFWLDEDQMIRTSYYRNVIVHFFVNRALAEMALGAVAETAPVSTQAMEETLLALRDLLKFEFFFPDKESFLEEVSADLSLDVPGWEEALAAGGAGALLEKLGRRVAHWSVLPFLDAYQIVGDELEALHGRLDEKAFLKACLARARMYRIEGRLISGESASQVLFKSALALARNRDLIEGGSELHIRRAEFAAEVRMARLLAAEGL